MKTRPNGTDHAAFTLLEMVIVLAILALLTHLAVQRFDQGSLKPRQARQQLLAIERAILGTSADLDPAGQPTRLGFVADMGCLPRTRANAQGALTLADLWQCPENDAFAVRPATPENLAPGSNPSDADPQVYLACGWRGPYLEPTRSHDTLLDPWGNPFSLNQGSVSMDDEIRTIHSFGSDGAPGWDGHTDTARDIALTNTPAASLTVIPTFHVRLSDSDTTTTEIDPLPRPTRLRVYSPCGARIAVASTPLQSIASGAPLTLEHLTPGPRVMRIERDGIRTEIRTILLSPGSNVIRLP